jgi:hypothetical protein
MTIMLWPDDLSNQGKIGANPKVRRRIAKAEGRKI